MANVFFHSKNQERVGEIFVFLYIAIFGFFPIVANHVSKLMPGILFMGVSTFLTGVLLFFWLFFKRELSRVKNWQALKYILVVTCCNVIFPFILIAIGTRMTSGINTSILMQTELLFTFLVCGFIFHEKITKQKLIGAAIILIGATSVLYNGTLKLNWGDLLIVLATVLYPFGNQYAKKALALTTPSVVLFVRTIIGGAFLIMLSILVEPYDRPAIEFLRTNIWYILANGLLILGIAKIFWFEALKRLDVTKAISMVIAEAGFSFIYAIIFLREIPTYYQMAGLIFIIYGLLILTKSSTPKASPLEPQ